MEKKKVLLIHPANPVHEKSPLPPLGLITVASHIPPEYEIQLVDEAFDTIDFDEADLVLLSSNSATVARAYEIARIFKEKNIPSVLGGIHASLMPEEAAQYVDSIAIGNGENIIKEILSDFENKSLKKVYRPPLFDLAESLPPRRDLLGEHYSFDLLETTRGCPFDCDFCSVTVMNGKKYRYKSLEAVAKDLDTLPRKQILITDDNVFGSGPKAYKRSLELMQLIKNYHKKWAAQTSINIADHPEALKLARQSGAMTFYIGFESISEDFLKAVNKSVNLRKGIAYYKEAVDKIHEAGITIIGSFIVGTDYDTVQDLRRLNEFIDECGIDAAFVKPLFPLPGTKLYHEMKDKGRLFKNDFWMQTPIPIYTFKPEKMTIEELHNSYLQIISRRNTVTSLKNYTKSLWRTRNFGGATTILATNIGEYKHQMLFLKDYLQRYEYPYGA